MGLQLFDTLQCARSKERNHLVHLGAMDALKSRLRATLYPPGTNPLNWKILFIVFCSVVGEVFYFAQKRPS